MFTLPRARAGQDSMGRTGCSQLGEMAVMAVTCRLDRNQSMRTTSVCSDVMVQFLARGRLAALVVRVVEHGCFELRKA
eukprot:10532811-Karenia_brevis.AAC.1